MPPFKEGTQQSYITLAACKLAANACSLVNPGISQLCLGGPAGYGSLTVETIDKYKYRFLQLFCQSINSGVGYSAQSKSYFRFTTARSKICSLPHIKGEVIGLRGGTSLNKTLLSTPPPTPTPTTRMM